ncbi:hypothetical protein NQ314_014831 [Rhamnusium bicolor]|uniref:DDE-1 domain-containing protein n=1 Tax=Rhamnusium bicolor TaxID=1586634 RepID=A0AAV8X110_9CUCU|nr:hypothetical protein NQ314_014831 [Rhamnusium bicolor]
MGPKLEKHVEIMPFLGAHYRIFNGYSNWLNVDFQLKKEELISTVQKIVLVEKIKTPFKNGKPGQKWYKSFLRRHPQVSARTAESINKSRAKITKEYIKSWFQELQNFLQEKGASGILISPSRIFNADESGFSFCPKTGKVLSPKGYRNLFEIKKGNEEDLITVLVTFTADGRLCPPCIVYPYVKPPRAVAESMPPKWILGKSDSGWMKSDSTGIVHMSVELSKFCDDNDIILYALPPNSTHIMQPADVGLFKPLKEYWRQAVRNWQNDHEGKSVTKIEFATVLEEALNNQNIPNHIRNAFRRCGLFPYNPDAVDYTKCVQNTLEQIQLIENMEQEALNSDDFKTTYEYFGTS